MSRSDPLLPSPRRVALALFALSVVLTGGLAALFWAGEQNVVTGLLLLAAAGTWVLFFAVVVLRGSSRWTSMVPRVALSVVTGTTMLILLELALRGLGIHANYPERNGSHRYYSPYIYYNPTWYHLYNPNTTVTDRKTEFTHERSINSIGLAEGEIPVAKAANEYRVIALGDSFTEGIGARYDETWVKVFERVTSRTSDGRAVHALNAGISSSDPLFEYVLLRDRLAAYRPDLIIAAVNNSDVTDVITRGGMERFRPDGTVRVDGGPAWEPLYAVSYITRHVMHDVLGYTWLLMTPSAFAEAQRAANGPLRAAIHAMAMTARTLGSQFAVVFFPTKYEVAAGAYDTAFGTLVEEFAASRDVETIDLLSIYTRDGTVTPANVDELYWPLDTHHDARGYAVMGQAIAAEIVRRGALTATDRAASASPMS
jgi:lysophospholipase L1-like esterase